MAKLKYLSNFRREEICEIDIHQISTKANIINYILEVFADYLKKRCDADHLRVVIEDFYLPFTEESVLNNPDAVIVYSEVVAPNNALVYAEQDGIVYFFHTKEGNHLAFPHIHAVNSGDQISIYLNSDRVDGNFKNRKKYKKATQYVKEHHDAMLREWNRIMGEN